MTSHENALYDLHYDSYNWPTGQTIETILLILSCFKQLDVSASASVSLYRVSCTLSVNYVHLGFTLALIRRKGNNITPYYTTQIHLVTHTWYNPVEVPILNFLHLKDQNTKTIKTCCIKKQKTKNKKNTTYTRCSTSSYGLEVLRLLNKCFVQLTS